MAVGWSFIFERGAWKNVLSACGQGGGGGGGMMRRGESAMEEKIVRGTSCRNLLFLPDSLFNRFSLRAIL